MTRKKDASEQVVSTPLQDRALALALDVAEEASKLVMTGFRQTVAIHKKAAISLVTEFDLRSEELIRTRLAQVFPGHTYVGEEKPASGTSEFAWYIDPIDGTTNFAHGHPCFCISLALYHGQVGLVGVVVAPALGVRWWATRAGGCYRDGARCAVTSTTELDDALCATGFAYDRRETDDDNIAEYRAFMKRTRGVRRCGAAALDLAMLADGTYDIFWEKKLCAWDFAAGLLLVSEAGGKLSTYDGSAMTLNAETLLASNGKLHSDAVSVLNSVARHP
jgi:myo-inositol-1(or 4)-monophosphatase